MTLMTPTTPTTLISIIIPVLNEEDSIKSLLQQLQRYRQQGHEIIVVDGGSHDKTVANSASLSDKVILSEPGRATQMNQGARQASQEILWFLHADTTPSEYSIDRIHQALVINDIDWGRFNIKLSGRNILYRVIERMINLRSCFSGIATGDQGIFVKKKTFEKVGGYSNLPLMEDIDLSRKLKKLSPPFCIKEKIMTSSRRWEQYGILATMLLMWRLRFLFWIGVSADKLAAQYK